MSEKITNKVVIKNSDDAIRILEEMIEEADVILSNIAFDVYMCRLKALKGFIKKQSKSRRALSDANQRQL